MNDSSVSVIRAIIKVLAGYFIARGFVDQSNAELITSGAVALVATIWGALHRSQPGTSQPGQTSGVKCLALPALVLSLAAAATGCMTSHTVTTVTLRPDGTTNSIVTSASSAPFYDGCIVKQSTRFFGFQFKEDAKTQIPYAVLGWGSEVAEIIPTAPGTNGISAPRSMTAFKLENSLNPFSTDITENSGAGDVYIGGTNDTSKAIVPSPYYPASTNR